MPPMPRVRIVSSSSTSLLQPVSSGAALPHVAWTLPAAPLLIGASLAGQLLVLPAGGAQPYLSPPAVVRIW